MVTAAVAEAAAPSIASPPRYEHRRLLFATDATAVPTVVLHDTGTGEHAVCAVRWRAGSDAKNLITPDICFEELWRGMQADAPARRVFTVALPQGVALWLYSAETACVECLVVTEDDAADPQSRDGAARPARCVPVFRIDAADAIGLPRTVTLRDGGSSTDGGGGALPLPAIYIAVLDGDGRLWLYRGKDKVLEMQLDWPAEITAATTPPRIVGFDGSSGAPTRTVMLEDGRRFGLAVGDLSPAMAPTRLCIAGLEAAGIPRGTVGTTVVQGYVEIKCDLAGSILVDLLREYLPLTGRHSDANDDWAGFRTACNRLFDRAIGGAGPVATTAAQPTLSAWSELLTTEAHRSPDAACFAGLPSASADPAADLGGSAAAAAVTAAGTPSPDPDTGSCRERVECLFLMLHLVYEQSKLNLYSSRAVGHIGQLLAELSVRLGWMGYTRAYLMDQPGVTRSIPAALITSVRTGARTP